LHYLQLLFGEFHLWQILGNVVVIVYNLLEDSTGLAIFLLRHICGGDIDQRVDSLVALGVLLLHFLENLHRFVIVLLIKELLARRVEVVGVDLTQVA